MKLQLVCKKIQQALTGCPLMTTSFKGVFVLFAALMTTPVLAAEPAQSPLFLSASAKPHIALVMSTGEQLTKKAYSDYANLDGNLLTMADTTYRDNFDYYGYFDSDWCYSYDSTKSYFTPHAKHTGVGHQCSGAGTGTFTDAGAWSGNFLNWATMTRMDILRKVLFGGLREVDTTDQTILRRAYIPNDTHSFVKIYKNTNNDINKFTPYTVAQSFCNTSTNTDAAGGSPIMKIAAGSFPQWAADERIQCRTGTGNSPAALANTVTIRVDACVAGKDADSSVRCRKYGTSSLKKPTGLLQKYGEDKAVKFSLTTSTYKAHFKGGVLRKKAGLIAGNTNASDDEINLTTGQFNSSVKGIISNISNFKITGWDFNGTSAVYSDCNTYSIQIPTVKAGTDTVKRCLDWGNPISEVYLEALRYISGALKPTTAFNVDDSTAQDKYPGIAGLSKVSTWDDPWTEYCAQCSAIVISTGANMFDGDDLAPATNSTGGTAIVGLANADAVKAKTDTVGSLEFGGSFSGNYFMGGTADGARYCQSTSLTALSGFLGICPEMPALEGTYNIAGLAYHAHITDLRPSLTGKQTVNTYAIDLAESVPTLKFDVGGSEVSLIPSCESNGGAGYLSCSLIDVQVADLTLDSNQKPVSGSFIFYWEDSLWGNDYDLDVSQRIDFCIGAACSPTIASGHIKLTTTMPSAAAGNGLRVSYSIYGVDHAKGEINIAPSNRTHQAIDKNVDGGLFGDFVYCEGGCFYTNTAAGDGLKSGNSTIEFTAAAGTGTVKTLKSPLWYAAKYGGFVDKNSNDKPDDATVVDGKNIPSEWDSYKGVSDGIPDNFSSVKNPALLEDKLETALLSILRKAGSASAVSTSSTRLSGDDFVYQAIFASKEWSGELRAYKPDEHGVLPATPTYKTSDTGRMPLDGSQRNIITYYTDNTVGTSNADATPKETKEFLWDNLHPSQKALLAVTGDAPGMDQKRVDWLRGNATYENNNTLLRERKSIDENSNTEVRNILGDIVNSSPAYAGAYNFNYQKLTVGGSSYKDFLLEKLDKTPLVLVGANDGMVHAFVANSTNASEILTEKFAYIPGLVYSKLAKITNPDYGISTFNKHQFLIDGPITVGDVYINNGWHTVAVGTLGAGGKGIYALDITDPATPTVLFEYTNANMGYVLGRPFIVPTKGGRWAAVFGNGTDSGTNSKLFMVDIESPFSSNTKILTADDGTSLTNIKTNTGTGLSSTSILIDGSGYLTDVYAGDLSGNMWHFVLGDASSTNWSSYKVFAANTGQPITASPTIGRNNVLGTTMVYFGTGKYFDENDNSSSISTQSFYAVPDFGSGNAVTRAKLKSKTITAGTGNTPSRTVSTENPDWGENQKGWYIDFTLSVGERVTTKALLVQDKLLITTLIPSIATCEAGGQSWLMEVTAIGDRYVNEHVLPNNIFSDQLYLGDQNIALKDIGTVSIVNSGTKAVNLTVIDANINARMFGRQSWRQLR